VEFFILNLQGAPVEIEPWKPEHTMTWLKIMAYDLGGNLQDELNRLDLLRLVGREKAEVFYPEYPAEQLPYILSLPELTESLGELLSFGVIEPTAAAPAETGEIIPAPFKGALVGGLRPEEPLALGKGGTVGSNSWVIGGARTGTGAPILAADLHLGVQMPSIWYEVVLHAEVDELGGGGGGFHAGGFSFAGVPGIVLGHNRRIAWGLTNVNPDVQDLYLERVNPENPREYLVEGNWVPMELRVEEITVRGGDEPIRHLVRSTRNGPIVTDAEGPQDTRSAFGIEAPLAPPESVELSELSLRWTALVPNRTFSSLFRMNRAGDFAEFREAAALFDIPSQNLVYADEEGNIGYQTPGLIPIRRRGDGRYPVPGWDDRFQWDGFVPFEELPWVLNPEKGYLTTANNPVAPPGYPHHITADFAYGYRAKRIVEMIEGAGEPITVEDVVKMQADSYAVPARRLVRGLLSVRPEEVSIGERSASAAQLEALQRLIQGWDQRMSVDSAGAAAYALAFQGILEAAVHDEIPEELWSRSRLLKNTSRISAFLEAIIEDPENPWWDEVTTLGRRETRDEILLEALGRGVIAGKELLGDEMGSWRWGELHTVTFRNQTFGESGIPLLEAIFNRGPVEVPSGLDQVYSADYDLADPFEVVNHSSMRQIIDLSDLGNSRFIHSTGQSGHPYHRHYDDFIERWSAVEYHPHRWERERLESEDPRRLLLEP
jgi:penicillin amidase